MKHFIAANVIFLSIASTLTWAVPAASAQQPIKHEPIRCDMPPGVAADFSRMSKPLLAGYVQPVRLICPNATKIEVANLDGYAVTNKSQVSVGMLIGPVYRFKVSNIPHHPGNTLYPSVEVLNRLNPPHGLENDFPVEVVITQDDLKQAIGGRLVTKVIYLEDPETALHHRHSPNQQPSIDVGGYQDPMRVSKRLGRPMAILRIGSRIPMPSDRVANFNFNAPAAPLLPSPSPIVSQPATGQTGNTAR